MTLKLGDTLSIYTNSHISCSPSREMAPSFSAALAAAISLVASLSFAEASDSIVLYRDYYYGGNKVELGTGQARFPGQYNDWASSAQIRGGTWMLYSDFDYQGTVSIRGPGKYSTPHSLGIKNDVLSSIRPLPPPSATSIVLFRDYNFKGPMLHLTGASSDLRFFGFNDHASSVIVLSGAWRLYQHVDYKGNTVVMKPGRYPRVDTNDDLSSCSPLPGSEGELMSEVTEELEQFRHEMEESE